MTSLVRPAQPPADRPVRVRPRRGRSQTTAGWLHQIAGDGIDIRSAGSEPADQINPIAVQAMAEVGIDITAEQPKLPTVDAGPRADVVITMGCGDTCPSLASAERSGI